MPEQVLKAGVATANITPLLGGSLAGSMRDRTSTHVHDDLSVRCLMLDNGTERVAFAVCDLVALGKEHIEQAKHRIHGFTGMPMTNILVAATHTHTAATTVGVFQSEPDPAYMDWLVVRIADCVRCAANNLRPARIGWATGHEDRMVFNRRFFLKPGCVPPDPFGRTTDRVKMNPGYENPNIVKPAGPIDPEIGLLAVQDTAGEPLALLGNYALHYVGGGRGSDVSADYFAMWASAVARMAGVRGPTLSEESPPFLAIMTNGCSGDINNVDVSRQLRQPHPYHQMRKVAEIVAAESFKAWQEVEYHDWVPLGVRETTLELGVRKPAASEIARAKEILAKATDPVLKTLEEIYARETVLLAERPDTVTTPLQAIRVGDLGIVTFPGEAFVEMGLEVKKKSPFGTNLCIELANDYAGYIPTPEAHEQGGYETWRARSSFLETGASPKMVAAVVQMLEELAKEQQA